MRLLNAHDGTLHQFHDWDVPKYATLSHTWRENEIIYSDLSPGHAESSVFALDKPSAFKVKRCCQQALKDKLDYVWIDTLCIDKSSSSELNEAINSMFAWYQQSEVCYAYLDDFPAGAPFEKLQQCRWFSRGWTLQELLAPKLVVFFGQEWQLIGEKSKLWEPLSVATGIPEKFIYGEDFRRASIAQRMSWAAKRQTARVEDIAYCLLGIFDVSLPLKYGDKQRAFVQLQEAIIEGSTDHSLFAWSRNDGSGPVGILAQSPADFAMCGNIVPYPSAGTSSYTMTNKGLQIDLPIITAARPPHFPRPHAIIRCHTAGDLLSDLAIPLKHTGGIQYVRQNPRPLPKVSELEVSHGRRDETTLIHLQKQVNLSQEERPRSYPFGAYIIRRLPSRRSGFQMDGVWPSEVLDTESKIISNQTQPTAIAFQCARPSIPFNWPLPDVIVVCGIHQDLSNQLFPWCFVDSAKITGGDYEGGVAQLLPNVGIFSDSFTKTEDGLKLPAGVDTYHFRARVWKEELVDTANLFSLDIWVEESSDAPRSLSLSSSLVDKYA